MTCSSTTRRRRMVSSRTGSRGGSLPLRQRHARRRHPPLHPRTQRRVRVPGRSRLGRIHRLGHRDDPPRGRGPAGHPQRGPPAEALAGTAPPGPAPQVLVLLLLLLRPAGPARSRRACQPLALLPALPARRPPGLHTSTTGIRPWSMRCHRPGGSPRQISASYAPSSASTIDSTASKGARSAPSRWCRPARNPGEL